jgi:hypothetical protein
MTTETNNFASMIEVVKNVTREFFVIPEDGSPMYLKFDSPFAIDNSIEIRTRRSKNDDPNAPKEPMEIADVTNLQTGEVGRLIGNSVIKSELRKAYPNDGYVDRYFQITQGAMKTGKTNKYRSFKIVEIKLRSTTPSAHESQAKGTTKK